MSETFFVRPSVEGAVIRDPVTKDILPDAGRSVPANAYWRGLELRGDVIVIPPPSEPPIATEPASAPKSKTSKEV